MRKLTLILGVLFLLASCAKEDTNNGNGDISGTLEGSWNMIEGRSTIDWGHYFTNSSNTPNDNGIYDLVIDSSKVVYQWNLDTTIFGIDGTCDYEISYGMYLNFQNNILIGQEFDDWSGCSDTITYISYIREGDQLTITDSIYFDDLENYSKILTIEILNDSTLKLNTTYTETSPVEPHRINFETTEIKRTYSRSDP